MESNRMLRGGQFSDEGIKEIYKLINDWLDSDLTMSEFCKIIGVPTTTFYNWRGRFIPGNSRCNERWIKIAGTIVYERRQNITIVRGYREKWLDYCNSLKQKD